MNLSKLATIDIHEASKKAEAFTPGSDPLPPGIYTCRVEKAEVKATNAGDGHMVKVQLRVQGGEFDNRVMFDTMLFDHPSEKAQSIGVERLSTLAKASGLPSIPPEAETFINKVVNANAYIGKKRMYQGKEQPRENEIAHYLIAEGVTQAAPPASGGELPDNLPF